MNKEYIEELSIKRYKRNLNSVIDTLIKPYLNAKTNKISKHKPSIVIYMINCELYHICEGASIYDDTDKILNMVEVLSKTYINKKYVSLSKQEELSSEYKELLKEI